MATAALNLLAELMGSAVKEASDDGVTADGDDKTLFKINLFPDDPFLNVGDDNDDDET